MDSAGDPGAGLVGVQDVGGPELSPQFVEETVEPICCFGRQARQPTGRHRCPADLGEQFRRPGHRDVLADHQIDSRRPHDGAVTSGSYGLFRERRFCDGPATATPGLGLVLGHLQAPHWQVVDLAGFTADDLGADQALPTSTALVGHVELPVVGHLGSGQHRPGGTRLLARSALHLFRHELLRLLTHLAAALLA